MPDQSEQIVVRRAVKNDAEPLAEIGKLTFTLSYKSIIPQDELKSYTSRAFGVDRLRSELADPKITYLLATVQGSLCGYARLEPTQPPPEIDGPRPIELTRLYAMPRWVGRGVGTKLMNAILGTAVRGDYESCWLRVWQGNDRAITFYLGWGFHTVGSEQYFVGRTSRMVLLMMGSLSELGR
ncbi:MAG: GNAT family N-acetyltransferase [Phycisphaerales bacterium]|nr:MAG: GNAT family N-acetyltransferase [Phycisphaerales bacterium]